MSNSTYKTSIGSGTRIAPPLRAGTLGVGFLMRNLCNEFDCGLFVILKYTVALTTIDCFYLRQIIDI